MKDQISNGLLLLAAGLRPYIAGRVNTVLRDSELAEEISTWDAQALMIFMWNRWNELFRNELSFVERSLISELRDFRNRWAHQDQIEEADVYRILDDIERLLKAIHSTETKFVTDLRRESLNRLWLQEMDENKSHRFMRVVWPYLICGFSALSIGATIIVYGTSPWSWLLAGLVFLAMMRIAFLQASREEKRGSGPHECPKCGRIIYTAACPYCSPTLPARPTDDGAPSNMALPLAGLSSSALGRVRFGLSGNAQKAAAVPRQDRSWSENEGARLADLRQAPAPNHSSTGVAPR